MQFVCLLLSVTVCGIFQVSASRSDLEEAEENALQNQWAKERTEEGLFDMVTTVLLILPGVGETFSLKCSVLVCLSQSRL